MGKMDHLFSFSLHFPRHYNSINSSDETIAHDAHFGLGLYAGRNVMSDTYRIKVCTPSPENFSTTYKQKKVIIEKNAFH